MANVGIEIENESLSVGRTLVRQQLPRGAPWRVESDGSLRGGEMGWEIKTIHDGVPIESLEYALSALYPVMQDASGTWRAAIHVHVDMRDRSWYGRALALAFAYCVDESVFRRFAYERLESNFCVALSRKTTDVFQVVREMLAYGAAGAEHNTRIRGYGKYSSVNVDSLATFGTYEYRHMRTPATSRDTASVQQALRLIAKFADAAHTISTCEDVTGSTQCSSVGSVASCLESLCSARSFVRTRGLEVNPVHAMEMQALIVSCLPFDRGERLSVESSGRHRPTFEEFLGAARLRRQSEQRAARAEMDPPDVEVEFEDDDEEEQEVE